MKPDDKLDVALDNLYDALTKTPTGTSKAIRDSKLKSWERDTHELWDSTPPPTEREEMIKNGWIDEK